MEFFIIFMVFGGPLLLGSIGYMRERQHLADLLVREAGKGDILVTQLRSFPECAPGPTPPTLVMAEVVLGVDYLKVFLLNLRNLFGGEARSLQRLVDRARREALLRLLDQARSQGYSALCNVRLDTADIGGGMTRQGMPLATILASGTAYHRARP